MNTRSRFFSVLFIFLLSSGLFNQLQLNAFIVGCLDLTGVDFGPCDAILGIALVDGECQEISGCSQVGADEFDYSPYFQESFLVCVSNCIADPFASCVDSNLIGISYPCTFEYAPVCGCDGVTYANECDAIVNGGLVNFSPGECPENDCTIFPAPEDLDWIDNLDFYASQLTQYYYNGELVYYYESCDPFLADAVNILYDCTGNQICLSGGDLYYFENCPDFLTTGQENMLIVPCNYNPCDFSDPIADLPWIDSLLTELSMYEDCGCNTSFSLVDYGGVTTFLLDSDCNFIDQPDVMYDCTGEIVCLQDGEIWPPYCFPNGYTILETLWTCDNGIVNPTNCTTFPSPEDLAWTNDLDMSHHQLSQYYYNNEIVYYYEVCNPLLDDGLDVLYDCAGNEICLHGGFVGYNFEDCPDFEPNPWNSSIIIPCGATVCDYENPVTDLPWIDSLLANLYVDPDCDCGTSFSIVNYGGLEAFYLDAGCSNWIDAPDVMYDCEGNVICLYDGETGGPYCSPENFSHVETLWNCTNGIIAGDLMEMNLSLKVFLEGPMENGQMTTNLWINNLLDIQPYNNAPYYYSGPFLTGLIPDNAVDFILIELREDFGMPAASQQIAFVLTNGDIVLENGDFPHFIVEASKTYQVWLRHHNHLDIVSSEVITPAPMVERHFLAMEDAMGPEQLKEAAPGVYAMYAGDINKDGVINVTDYDAWVLSPAVVNQYLSTDINLDGIVQATDYDFWFENKAKIGFAQNQ